MVGNKDIENILVEYGQEHILKYVEKLEETKKDELLEQIEKIDFDQLTQLYHNTKKEMEIKENKIEAIPYLDKSKLTNQERYEFETEGEKTIKNRGICSSYYGRRSRNKTWSSWTKGNI